MQHKLTSHFQRVYSNSFVHIIFSNRPVIAVPPVCKSKLMFLLLVIFRKSTHELIRPRPAHCVIAAAASAPTGWGRSDLLFLLFNAKTTPIASSFQRSEMLQSEGASLGRAGNVNDTIRLAVKWRSPVWAEGPHPRSVQERFHPVHGWDRDL